MLAGRVQVWLVGPAGRGAAEVKRVLVALLVLGMAVQVRRVLVVVLVMGAPVVLVVTGLLGLMMERAAIPVVPAVRVVMLVTRSGWPAV